MNNKYVLRFFYGISILIALGLIIFYGRLTLPSLIIGTLQGDPLLVNNAIVLMVQIFIISIIGYINYFFHKKLYGIHREGDNNTMMKILYFVIVLAVFVGISIFALLTIGIGV